MSAAGNELNERSDGSDIFAGNCNGFIYKSPAIFHTHRLGPEFSGGGGGGGGDDDDDDVDVD